MKKVLAGAVIAGILSTVSFGFEEYYSFVNNMTYLSGQ